MGSGGQLAVQAIFKAILGATFACRAPWRRMLKEFISVMLQVTLHLEKSNSPV
ncbi:hypothetical protein PAE9249_02827 [Paenibacillus sp. CECT 9249]|nr:hypothetical protein PAE9249_02827 [Paenibacillus sp. CECT 9249]